MRSIAIGFTRKPSRHKEFWPILLPNRTVSTMIATWESPCNEGIYTSVDMYWVLLMHYCPFIFALHQIVTGHDEFIT